MDLFMNQFDQFLLEECDHLKDDEIMVVMREIQNISALICFIMIHIPLSRISSLFSLLTVTIPMALDKKNKINLYLKLNRMANSLTFSNEEPI